MSAGPNAPELIRKLVESCLEHLEEGDAPAIEALLRAHPLYAERVLARLEYLRRIGLLERVDREQ